jgi:hypothetical protein
MSDSLWVYNGSPEIDAQSQYPKIMAVSIVLTLIMTVILSLRWYVRAVMLRNVGIDDWVILAAAVTILFPELEETDAEYLLPRHAALLTMVSASVVSNPYQPHHTLC